MIWLKLSHPDRANARRRVARAFALSAILHVGLVVVLSPRLGTTLKPSWDEPQPGHRSLQVTLRTSLAPIAESSSALSVPPLQVPTSLSLNEAPQQDPTTPTELPQTERSPTQGEYLLASRLSKTPELQDMGTLDRPGLATAEESGRLVVELLINEQGRVDGVLALETTMPAKYLANALGAFQRGIFKPGMELNRPVKSRLRIEVVLHRGVSGSPTALKELNPTATQYLPSETGDH